MYTNYPNTEKMYQKNDPKGSTQHLGEKNNPGFFYCLLHSISFVFLNYYLSENIFIVYAYLFVIIYRA